MPYKIRKVKGGYKVFSPKGAKSKKPLSKKRAQAQQRAIYANAPHESFTRKLDAILTPTWMEDEWDRARAQQTQLDMGQSPLPAGFRGAADERGVDPVAIAKALKYLRGKRPKVNGRGLDQIVRQKADKLIARNASRDEFLALMKGATPQELQLLSKFYDAYQRYKTQRPRKKVQAGATP